jgi:proteasome activator-like protein
MSPTNPEPDRNEMIAPEIVGGMPPQASDGQHEDNGETISGPAKVLRIGSMVKQLLDEVRNAPLDERSRERLAEIYDRSVEEVRTALSPDLQHELESLTKPFAPGVAPSEPELRVAKAQLVGWLEGLFQGIQASLVAQQLAARQQLEQMRRLGPGQQVPGQGTPQMPEPGPGTYL